MRDRRKGWRQTDREGDREGEQTSVSNTSIVGCGEMMRNSQSEGWMDKETEETGETKCEETKRKKVPEREQASMSGELNAGSEVLMTGREGASGGQMWAYM